MREAKIISATPATEPRKTVSRWKQVGLWVFMVASIIVMVGLVWLSRGFWNVQDEESPIEGTGTIGDAIVFFVSGVLTLGAGLGSYGLVLGTSCFTVDFSRPIWRSFKSKMYIASILVSVPLVVGVAFLAAIVVTPLLRSFGASTSLSVMAPFMGTFVVLQVASIWFSLFAPIDKPVIRKRLAAQGVPAGAMQGGWYLGISDPDVKKRVTFGGIEDDIGMMWIEPDRILYLGDNDQFEIARGQLLAMERKADANSVSFLGGNVSVILRFLRPDGVERKVRLHPEGCWTLGIVRRTSDQLAARTTEWRNPHPPAAPPVLTRPIPPPVPTEIPSPYAPPPKLPE